MTIERKFKTQFDIYRQVWQKVDINGVEVDRSEEVLEDTFKGYRQQGHGGNNNPEYFQSLGLDISKSFVIWCSECVEVTEGDVLRSKFGTDKVRMVQTNLDGRNPHKQLLVEHIGFDAHPQS